MVKAHVPASRVEDTVKLGHFYIMAFLVVVCVATAVFLGIWATVHEFDLYTRTFFGALAGIFLSGAVSCVVAERMRHEDRGTP